MKAHSIAQFSIGQVGLFVLFFAVAVILVSLVISGAFQGNRAKWGALLMGTLLVDMARANEPWIISWNYAG